MPRQQALRIADMIEACDRILRYSAGMNRQQFGEQAMVRDAILRNLGIIGTASKTLSGALKARFSEVEWNDLAGLPDIASCVSSRIDLDLIWSLIQNVIPDLRQQLIEFQNKNPQSANDNETPK